MFDKQVEFTMKQLNIYYVLFIANVFWLHITNGIVTL